MTIIQILNRIEIIYYFSPFSTIIRCLNINNITLKGRNPDETLKMMKYCIDYNNTRQPTINDKISISLELEKLRPEILCLCEFADIIFLGRDFANYLGYPDKKTAVHELRKKITRKRFEIPRSDVLTFVIMKIHALSIF